jgi:type IX secretion system PorP/SprF family membrane protein
MRFMKKLLVLFFVIIAGKAQAQQDPQYSLNMFNIYSVNPAFAGSYDQFNALAIHRSQWAGFDGAPTTQHLSLEAPVYFLHGGAGITVTNDKVGVGYQRGVNISYAYQTKLTKKAELGVGFSFGFTDTGFEGTWLAPDGTSGANDDAIPSMGSNSVSPDLGMGIYYRLKEFYLGLAVTHLLESKAEFDEIANVGQVKHYYLTSGFKYDLNTMVTLKPSFYMKTDGVSAQYDFNMMVDYGDRFWGGMTYRVDDAVAMIVGLDITDNLKFGYAYDITVSDLKSESSGSHEVMLRYSFRMRPPTKLPTGYRNIRYN